MTADSHDDKPLDEHRLMALLALSSQAPQERKELPDELLRELDRDQPDPVQMELLHAHLDANPEAFEAFLRRHRHAGPVSEASVAPAARQQARQTPWLAWLSELRTVPLRYAVACGVAVLCAVFVVQTFVSGSSQVAAAIDGGYADLATQMDASKAAEIASSRDEQGVQFGFSPESAGTSSQARAFASGLASGRRWIIEHHRSGAADGLPSNDDVYYVLGEWNVLLWTGARSERPLATHFWQAQRRRHHLIVEAMSKNNNPDRLVAAHLQRVDTLLAALTQQAPAVRTSRELAEELQLFRAQFQSDSARN